ncbi:MAG: hypothetical protein Unbinned4944contig1000_8 [Prokaryotic dsDNA virus sp.]|nr:MAG: hypothetical protein Unbinned4944contig1000_8 [Prokaryotic dsDNA virus sp.]
MADRPNSSLDLSTPDKARKAMHDLRAEQIRLKKANRNLMENADKKTADLMAIQKRVSEMENRAGGSTTSSNATLHKYVRPDGSVRMKGEQTRDQAFMPGLLQDKPVCDWQADFQDAVSDYTLVKNLSGTNRAPKCLARVQEIARKAPVEVQKIFADSSGVGAEWIPDELLPALERNLTAQRRVAAAFDTMALPNKTTLLPYLTTGFRPYIKSAATSDDPAQYTSSSMVTEQRTITATGFAVRAQVADDAEEDSIIAVLPTVRQELISALVDGEEDAIINGDTGTHQDDASGALANWNIRGRWGDSGLGGSADHRRAWIGLRARAYDVSSTEDRSTFNADTLLDDRSNLDSPHGIDGSLILITSPEAYFKHLLAMDQVQTLDKFPQPTIVSGQLGQIYGMPIILSEFIGGDLHTTGLFTGSSATSGMLMVNRDRFKLGQLRGAQIEVDKDITRGTHQMVATVRETFFTVDDSTKKNLKYLFNL